MRNERAVAHRLQTAALKEFPLQKFKKDKAQSYKMPVFARLSV